MCQPPGPSPRSLMPVPGPCHAADLLGGEVSRSLARARLGSTVAGSQACHPSRCSQPLALPSRASLGLHGGVALQLAGQPLCKLLLQSWSPSQPSMDEVIQGGSREGLRGHCPPRGHQPGRCAFRPAEPGIPSEGWRSGGKGREAAAAHVCVAMVGFQRCLCTLGTGEKGGGLRTLGKGAQSPSRQGLLPQHPEHPSSPSSSPSLPWLTT